MGAVLGICEDLGRVARLPASLGKRLAVKGSKPAEKGPSKAPPSALQLGQVQSVRRCPSNFSPRQRVPSGRTYAS